ncbi:hypothetical protein [Jeongeupia chitinilytica]|uniref:hypothetical protein n=1 Tax=Jeongeupia chitinilytica TaxID=1041641 RepID=UPI0016724F56|nr:hypothetical protein [Jeongeupia chitinilytica]
MSAETNARWWEGYFVRYAQGSVIGALFVAVIFSSNAHLKSYLFMPKLGEKIEAANLLLMLAYGLVFCYVSSAPILVLHACRGLKLDARWSSASWTAYRCLTYFLLAAIIYFSLYLGFEDQLFTTLMAKFVMGVLAFLLSFQFVNLLGLIGPGWGESVKYFKGLAEKRGKADNKEYVESYRHLREHGNAFMILIFEFFFAAILYPMVINFPELSETPPISLVFVLLLWVLPAAMVWLAGTKLEHALVR